jgi:hypothetical protein
MNHDDGGLPSQQGANFLIKVIERVAVLSKEDELLVRGRLGRWQRASAIWHRVFGQPITQSRRSKDFAEQIREFAPLGILPAAADVGGKLFQTGECGNLGFEFRDGAGGGSLFENFLLCLLDLIL